MTKDLNQRSLLFNCQTEKKGWFLYLFIFI